VSRECPVKEYRFGAGRIDTFYIFQVSLCHNKYNKNGKKTNALFYCGEKFIFKPVSYRVTHYQKTCLDIKTSSRNLKGYAAAQ
jgi:hypothetical protein